MKNCTDCKHAHWKHNVVGNLHPFGDGMCGYEYKLPKLPACMHWISPPVPFGGPINRHSELNEHCPYWEHKRG